jgi:four helix bundle protein
MRIAEAFDVSTPVAASPGMTIRSYEDLEAWQVAMDFATAAYIFTKQFPRDELHVLSAQLRRAAIAIPSNISEGHHHGTKAYAHFVTLALGSLAEAQTQIELARRLGFASEGQLGRIADTAATLRRLLHGLRRSLRARL